MYADFVARYPDLRKRTESTASRGAAVLGR
jgi:hypothetical protein